MTIYTKLLCWSKARRCLEHPVGSQMSCHGWLLCNIVVTVSVAGYAAPPTGTEYAQSYSPELGKDTRIGEKVY